MFTVSIFVVVQCLHANKMHYFFLSLILYCKIHFVRRNKNCLFIVFHKYAFDCAHVYYLRVTSFAACLRTFNVINLHRPQRKKCVFGFIICFVVFFLFILSMNVNLYCKGASIFCRTSNH